MAVTGNRIWPTIWLLVAVGIGISYFVPPSCFPPCPLHALTGLNCPGCGATRAAHELLHGHILTALHMNAPLVLMVPVLLAIGLWQMLSGNAAERVQALVAQRWWGWLILLLILTFGIMRNIPSYPFTLLAP